jgi:hypothetical protein
LALLASIISREEGAMIKVPKKLIEETKRLIRLRLFLNECGLSRYHFSVGELRQVLKTLSLGKEKT